MNDLISRQAVIEVLSLGKEMLGRVLDDTDVVGADREKYSWGIGLIESDIKDVEELPSAEPEITLESAIDYLHSIGWMQNHDREMYESGLRERLTDDSGSYGALIPCDDTISRQAAIEVTNRECQEWRGIFARIEDGLKTLPPAEPEVRTGKWRIYAKADKYNRMTGEHDLVCNQCGYFVANVRSRNDIPRFCGGCGAKMEGWR